MVMYGGDEISAIVIDVGTHTTRAGYAGEEAPRCAIPTTYGWKEVEVEVDDEDESVPTIPAPVQAENGETNTTTTTNVNGEGMEGVESTDEPRSEEQDVRAPAIGAGKKKKIMEKRYYMGDNGANVWRDGMEVDNMMRDGIIADPNPLPHLLSHIYHEKLRVDPSEHPLLVTEPAWNTAQARETFAEIAFEGEGVPAFYVACSSVLSAFSAGRGTALIVDIGTDLTSVVPVSDGYALRAGTKRQPLSMTLLHSQMKNYLTSQEPPISLTPHQLIKSRVPVDAGRPAQFTLNKDRSDRTTASWRDNAENKVVEGWREAVAEVSAPRPFVESELSTRPRKLYEFPTGYSQNFGVERYRLPEILFDPAQYIDRSVAVPSQLLATPTSSTSQSFADILPLTELIYRSVMACDSDQRGPLLAHVVLVGGGAFIPGLQSRLDAELNSRFPGQKLKIHSPGNSIERKYSSWLGGSILGSLGTFHQLWVAKSEWEEYGPAILRQRCK